MTETEEFISTIDNHVKRQEALELLSLLEDVSGNKAYLTGSIIGFGKYHYKYESGREGDSAVIAFSPRKQKLVIYIMSGFSQYTDLLASLGKYKLGKSCLYINKLADIDIEILRQIAALSIVEMREKHECTNT